MTNKQLLEKLQEDMELRRIFKVHKVQLLPQRKRNNRIFWKTNEASNNKRIKKISNEIFKRKKASRRAKYQLLQ